METELLIGLVVVLILLVAYYVWKQHKHAKAKKLKAKFTDYEAAFQHNQKVMNWERNPYEPEVRDEAKKGKVFDGSPYTGSASKYFPGANSYPTLADKQIEIAQKEQYESNVLNAGGEFNPEDFGDVSAEISDYHSEVPQYVHQEYMEDSFVTPKMKQNQHEFATSLQPYSGVSRNVDTDLDVASTLSWTGLRRPQPIKMHGIMPWVTEVDSEQLAAGSKPFNFQG